KSAVPQFRQVGLDVDLFNHIDEPLLSARIEFVILKHRAPNVNEPAKLVQPQRWILRVTVVREMATGPIQLQPPDVRRINRLVTALDQLFLDEGLQKATDDRPFWHPQNEPAADHRADGKEPELFAKNAVVAFFRFL